MDGEEGWLFIGKGGRGRRYRSEKGRVEIREGRREGGREGTG